MHICHFDGFFQKSVFTLVQLTGEGSGGGAGSDRMGVSKPISDRLPMVSRRVIAQLSCRYEDRRKRVARINTQTKRVKQAWLSSGHLSSSDEAS